MLKINAVTGWMIAYLGNGLLERRVGGGVLGTSRRHHMVIPLIFEVLQGRGTATVNNLVLECIFDDVNADTELLEHAKLGLKHGHIHRTRDFVAEVEVLVVIHVFRAALHERLVEFEVADLHVLQRITSLHWSQ